MIVICASHNPIKSKVGFFNQQIYTLQVYIKTSCITCTREIISCKQTDPIDNIFGQGGREEEWRCCNNIGKTIINQLYNITKTNVMK